GPLTVYGGGQPGDRIIVNDTGMTTGVYYEISNFTFTRSGASLIGFAGVASLQVDAGSGDDTFAIFFTGAATTVNGNGGNDGVYLGFGGSVEGIVHPVTANLGGQAGDLVLADNSNEIVTDHVTVTPTQVGAAPGDTYFGPGGSLTYSGAANLI